MTITTNTTDRKALAKAIAEELGTTARYLGLPSYGYQIGDFTVDHDGNIIGGFRSPAGFPAEERIRQQRARRRSGSRHRSTAG